MPLTDNGDRASKLRALLERVSGGSFREGLGEMALCFLAWEPRLAQMDAAAAAGDGGWAQGNLDKLRSQFVDHFQSSHLGWTREDTDGAFGLFRHCGSFADWYRVVIATFGIKVSFDAGSPQIPLDHARAWQIATNRVDPDSVVAFLFAEEGPMQDTGQLRDWPPITPIGANDFDEIMNRGIADLHVHMGGVRSGYIMWRRIMHKPDMLRFVTRYRPKEMRKLLPDQMNFVQRESDQIARLADVLSGRAVPSHLEDALRQLWVTRDGPLSKPRDEILAESATERLMLAKAWQRLLSTEEESKKYALEAALDRYLFVKTSFMKHHRQPEQANPGLGGFRRFFHSTAQASPKSLKPTSYAISPKREGRELAEYATYIAQSRPLKRLELRIAPKENPVEYHRFFKFWSETEDEFGFAGCDIRFAVHFKRSLDSKRDEPASDSLRRFLSKLDLDSAQLHAYRRKSGEVWQENVHRIARVDFAGQERDLPVHLAALCMNLVRGLQSALKAIDNDTADERLHRFWRMHHMRNEATQRVDLPKLGVTCHAGEDYAHPLEGLHSIASAVEVLEMGAGDTIGHGLALGADIEKFDAHNSPGRLTARGSQFDALLWLLFELEQNDSLASSSEISGLRHFVLDEVRHIYGRQAARLQTLQDLRHLSTERICPLCRAQRTDSVSVRMRRAELEDASCAGIRAERVPLDKLVYNLGPVLKRVQERLLKKLVEKGIVLELNPSSNLRVSGSGSMAEAPFIAIVNLHRACLATVNSDNPGVYGTRIENEFALVVSALRDVGISRTEAMAIVDRLRRIGLESVYWPKKDTKAQSAARSGAHSPIGL